MELYSPAQVIALLSKYNIHPKKSLGQNFLVDKNIIDKIANSANLTDKDTVIEIGPGLGTMTTKLAELSKQVIAIELDEKMVKILTETLQSYGNTDIVHGDAMKFDYSEIMDGHAYEYSLVDSDDANKPSFKVIANLPYYISSPLVLKLVKQQLPITMMVFMLQKEVAERFAAKPGTKDYGAITVILNSFYHIEALFNVPKSVFYPSPKVESKVIRATIKDHPVVSWEYQQQFVEFINRAFANRRKTLGNNLVPDFIDTKYELAELLNQIGLKSNLRAEQLTVEEFAEIFKIIYNIDK